MKSIVTAIWGFLASMMLGAAILPTGAPGIPTSEIAGLCNSGHLIGTTHANWQVEAATTVGSLRTGNLALIVNQFVWNQSYLNSQVSRIEGVGTVTPQLSGSMLTADMVVAWDGFALSPEVRPDLVRVTFNDTVISPEERSEIHIGDIVSNNDGASQEPFGVRIQIDIAAGVPAGSWIELGAISASLAQQGGGWADQTLLYDAHSLPLIGGDPEVDPGDPTPPPPGECSPWESIEQSGRIPEGTCVTHVINGKLRRFKAAWDIESDVFPVPGDSWSGPWMEYGDDVIAPDGHIYRRWTDSWINEAGDIVEFDGAFFRAQWRDRNRRPDELRGQWQQIVFNGTDWVLVGHGAAPAYPTTYPDQSDIDKSDMAESDMAQADMAEDDLPSDG